MDKIELNYTPVIEVKKAKYQLEKDILALCKNFEKFTKEKVSDIDIVQAPGFGDNAPNLIGIDIIVKF